MDIALLLSLIGKGLRLQPAQQACFLLSGRGSSVKAAGKEKDKPNKFIDSNCVCVNSDNSEYFDNL